jgi:DNA-binding SARP family transcriptional activator
MQFYLFGKFTFFDQERRRGLDRLSAFSKLQEVLAYLLVYVERPVKHEEIAQEVWGDSFLQQTSSHACKSLKRLKILLAEANLHLRNTPEGFQLDQNMNLWVDVKEFETNIPAVSSRYRETIDRQSIAKLLAIADLYRGPFLDGCYSPWCTQVRSILEQKYLRLLEISMDACETLSDYDTGIDCGLRAIALEHSRESAHLRLMRLFYLAGDRSSALRQYQRCMEALIEDLGIQPGEKTVYLYRQIQAGGQLPSASPRPLPASLHQTLMDLQNLDQTVSHLKSIQLTSTNGNYSYNLAT